MSKVKAAATVQTKVDPKRAATLQNQKRKLAKHVRLNPNDASAAAALKLLQSGVESAPRKASKEAGKTMVIRLVFRDSIDRLEFSHDEAGNPIMRDGKPAKRYEDRMSERVGVRESNLLQLRASLRGKMKFFNELKQPPKKLRYEYAGVTRSLGDALGEIINPNVVNLAKEHGLDLTRKPREMKVDDGTKGRPISVADAILQMINYRPRFIPARTGGEERGRDRNAGFKPKAKVEA